MLNFLSSPGKTLVPSGKIIIEFLKPIEPGLSTEEFSKKIYQNIEDASDILLEEAKREFPKWILKK